MPDLQAPQPVLKTMAPVKTSDTSKGMTVFVLTVTTLYFGKEVLVPITLALLLAFILEPLVAILRRAHFGRVPSVLVGVALALCIISAIGGVIGSQIGELSTDLPQYAATVESKIDAVKKFTVGRLTRIADTVGRHANGIQPSATVAAAIPGISTDLPVPGKLVSPQGTSPFDFAQRYLSPILSPLATLGIVFVVAVFALLQREDLRDRLIRLIGSNDLHRTTVAIDDAGRRLSRYFVTQLSINTLFGLAIGIGLLIIGVPNPILWGILSALLRFVPYVGSIISAVLPLALAAAVEPGWGMMLSTAALYIVIEGITGQAIEPLVYGHSTGLSPFSVVVAAIFWSWVWGPVGLILSTPLTLCLVVLGRHLKRLEFLDIMLGDRPALTPIESFYQRVLSGDADESQAQAELLLKDRLLSTYYDEVVIKSLQLASGDAQRGVLDDDQLDSIKATVKSVIRSLDRHIDRQAAPEKFVIGSIAIPEKYPLLATDLATALPGGSNALANRPAPAATILCISGGGPLDEAATMMLLQLLGKQGLKGRMVNYSEVSRDQIGALDISDVAMICITYLDISGSPAHLRYLIQRLRQRMAKDVSILVGLWPADDLKDKDAETRSEIGADHFTRSLEQTVTLCVQALV